MSNATLTARSNDESTATSQITQPSVNFLPIGLDVGNGAVKLYSSLGETLMEVEIGGIEDGNDEIENALADAVFQYSLIGLSQRAIISRLIHHL